jgi:hypothetical protein
MRLSLLALIGRFLFIAKVAAAGTTGVYTGNQGEWSITICYVKSEAELELCDIKSTFMTKYRDFRTSLLRQAYTHTRHLMKARTTLTCESIFYHSYYMATVRPR